MQVKTNMKKFIAVIFAGLFILSACTKEIVVKEGEPLLVIEKDLYDMPYEGGVLQIQYSILRPDSEMRLEVETVSDWIGAPDLGTDNIVSFRLDPNEVQEERRAEIIFRYGDGIEHSVEVVQAPYEFKAQFEFTVGNITDATAEGTVSPADKDMTYVVLNMEKNEFESLGSDDAVFRTERETFELYAYSMGVSLTEFLKSGILVTGGQPFSFISLKPASGYYVYAHGLDYNCNSTTPIVKELYYTKDIDFIDVSFDIRCDVNGDEVTVTSLPSDNSVSYYLNAMTLETYDSVFGEILEPLQETFYEEMSMEMASGKSMAEAIESITFRGEGAKTLVTAGFTDYKAYAFAVSATGVISSKIALQDFTSGKPGPSDNVITVSVSDVTASSANVSVSVTTGDAYILRVEETSLRQGDSDDEVLEGILSEPDLMYNIKYGNIDNMEVKDLDPGKSYTVYAFGYKSGAATTRLWETEFTTLSE